MKTPATDPSSERVGNVEIETGQSFLRVSPISNTLSVTTATAVLVCGVFLLGHLRHLTIGHILIQLVVGLVIPTASWLIERKSIYEIAIQERNVTIRMSQVNVLTEFLWSTRRLAKPRPASQYVLGNINDICVDVQRLTLSYYVFVNQVGRPSRMIGNIGRFSRKCDADRFADAIRQFLAKNLEAPPWPPSPVVNSIEKS